MNMAEYKVEQVGSEISVLGEEPHWDAESQSLFYIDILGAKLYRYDYSKNKTFVATVDGVNELSFLIPIEGKKNQFAVGGELQIYIISWDGVSSKAELISEVGRIPGDPDVQLRMNDTKADPWGRLIGGTMLKDLSKSFEITKGYVFQFSKEKGFQQLRGDVRLANGLAWNENTNKFYYVDSCAFDVKEYDYDPKTGNISNERKAFNFDDGTLKLHQVPDGITIDSDGNLYVAFFGKSKVYKINPNIGKIELEIDIPCALVTSCAFGGPNLDILYVTSGSTRLDGVMDNFPAGGLFKVTGLNAKGTKMHNVQF